MIKAELVTTNKNWIKYIGIPNQYINKKLKKIEKKTNLFKKNNYCFTILLSGDNEVKKLNIKFRKKNKTTDVLSYQQNESTYSEAIKKEKSYTNENEIINKLKSKNDEVSEMVSELNFDKIWIHGLTHLLGHRHKSNLDYSIMKKVENKLLQSIK